MTNKNQEELLPRNNKGEIILGEVFDASIWAKEFSKLFPMVLKDGEGAMPSEDLMLAWFANAIMAGYDHANRTRSPAQLKEK